MTKLPTFSDGIPLFSPPGLQGEDVPAFDCGQLHETCGSLTAELPLPNTATVTIQMSDNGLCIGNPNPLCSGSTSFCSNLSGTYMLPKTAALTYILPIPAVWCGLSREQDCFFANQIRMWGLCVFSTNINNWAFVWNVDIEQQGTGLFTRILFNKRYILPLVNYPQSGVLPLLSAATQPCKGGTATFNLT